MPLDGLRRLEAVLVEYAEDPYLHERRILAFDDEDYVVVCTPHFDIYTERWSEYDRLFLPGPRGGLPARWSIPPRSGRVVRFRPGAWEEKLDELAEKWCRELPSPRHGSLENARGMGAVSADDADADDDDEATVLSVQGGAKEKDGGRTAVDGETWVAVESRSG